MSVAHHLEGDVTTVESHALPVDAAKPADSPEQHHAIDSVEDSLQEHVRCLHTLCMVCIYMTIDVLRASIVPIAVHHIRTSSPMPLTHIHKLCSSKILDTQNQCLWLTCVMLA